MAVSGLVDTVLNGRDALAGASDFTPEHFHRLLRPCGLDVTKSLQNFRGFNASNVMIRNDSLCAVPIHEVNPDMEHHTQIFLEPTIENRAIGILLNRLAIASLTLLLSVPDDTERLRVGACEGYGKNDHKCSEMMNHRDRMLGE